MPCLPLEDNTAILQLKNRFKLHKHPVDCKTLFYVFTLNENGRLGIAPTRNCTHFLKIGLVVAGGGFYSYYIHLGYKSDKERKIVRKSLVLCIQKDLINFLLVQFCVGAIPRLPMKIHNDFVFK